MSSGATVRTERAKCGCDSRDGTTNELNTMSARQWARRAGHKRGHGKKRHGPRKKPGGERMLSCFNETERGSAKRPVVRYSAVTVQ